MSDYYSVYVPRDDKKAAKKAKNDAKSRGYELVFIEKRKCGNGVKGHDDRYYFKKKKK